jgi:hypothetical protein
MCSKVTSAKKCPEKYVPYGPVSDNVSNSFLDSYGVIREAYKGVVITVHCLPIPYVHTCMLTIGCAPSLAYISCMPCLSLLPFSTGGLCCPHPLKCGELPSRGGGGEAGGVGWSSSPFLRDQVGPCPFKPRAITLEIHSLPSGGVGGVGRARPATSLSSRKWPQWSVWATRRMCRK